jgi:cbb3-type cytochrome oxidase subunit 3
MGQLKLISDLELFTGKIEKKSSMQFSSTYQFWSSILCILLIIIVIVVVFFWFRIQRNNRRLNNQNSNSLYLPLINNNDTNL